MNSMLFIRAGSDTGLEMHEYQTEGAVIVVDDEMVKLLAERRDAFQTLWNLAGGEPAKLPPLDSVDWWDDCAYWLSTIPDWFEVDGVSWYEGGSFEAEGNGYCWLDGEATEERIASLYELMQPTECDRMTWTNEGVSWRAYEDGGGAIETMTVPWSEIEKRQRSTTDEPPLTISDDMLVVWITEDSLGCGTLHDWTRGQKWHAAGGPSSSFPYRPLWSSREGWHWVEMKPRVEIGPWNDDSYRCVTFVWSDDVTTSYAEDGNT